LNTFLKINKKLLAVLLLIITAVFFIAVFVKNLNLTKIQDSEILVEPTFDMINPSFTINNDKQKI